MILNELSELQKMLIRSSRVCLFEKEKHVLIMNWDILNFGVCADMYRNSNVLNRLSFTVSDLAAFQNQPGIFLSIQPPLVAAYCECHM